MNFLNKKAALVLLSGGQDSATCLSMAMAKYERVLAISFDYDQRHKIEVTCASKIATMSGIDQHIVRLGPVLSGSSPLVNKYAQVEKYKDASELPGGLEKTFVPGRNVLFLTIAANYAYCHGIANLVIGVSGEDFVGYPDCRPVFLAAMEIALKAGIHPDIRIKAPLINKTKKETVKLAIKYDGMDLLAWSSTCYEAGKKKKGSLIPCGSCHACLLREKGFREAGVDDPLLARLGLINPN